MKIHELINIALKGKLVTIIYKDPQIRSITGVIKDCNLLYTHIHLKHDEPRIPTYYLRIVKKNKSFQDIRVGCITSVEVKEIHDEISFRLQYDISL